MSHTNSIDHVEDARHSIERSRARHYLGGWEDSTRELTRAIETLKQLELQLRNETVSGEERLRLRGKLEAFRMELRLAERIHQQAGAWQNSWAEAVRGLLGLDGAAYGPDGARALQGNPGRMNWEG